jgi:hypothetical protein
MTIAAIRITASPVYDMNILCERTGIPYLYVQDGILERFGTDKDYVDTVLTPNRLAIVSSMAVLENYFASMVEQKVSWIILVRGSEEEANEYGLAYCAKVYKSWLLNSLTLEIGSIKKFPAKKLIANKNKSYLSQILTDLYRIKPKEARPFTQVFSYLSGTGKLPRNLPPYLVKSIKEAESVRVAIQELEKDYSIITIRAIAKKHKMDVFDLNYTLARSGLLPNPKDNKK